MQIIRASEINEIKMAGLTLSQMEKICGIPGGTISRIINGQNKLKEHNYDKLMRLLDVIRERKRK